MIVAFNFPPCASAGVHRTLRFTRLLREREWNSVILTATPNADSQIDSKLLQLVPTGIDVQQVDLIRIEEVVKNRLRKAYRRPMTQAKSQTTRPCDASSKAPSRRIVSSTISRLRKQITELCFAIPDNRIGWRKNAVARGLAIVEQQQPAVIYATAPPFSTLMVGHDIARRANLPLVLDFRDPWTRVPWGPRNKSWLANRWVARLESRCVHAAAAVILNTEELRLDFVHSYPSIPSEKFVAIPNGFDPELRSRVDSHLQTFETLPPPQHAFRLLHPGSLYRNRDPRPIVDAIALLKKQGITIILEQVGYCDPTFELEKYAADRNVAEQIEIKPPIPHDAMLRRMAEVDGFLLLQPETALQVPGKLYEMLLYQKPILALCVPGAVSRIIQTFSLGTIAEADDVQGISTALSSLDRSTTNGGKWGEAQDQFDGRKLTHQLADLFDRVSRR
ncbi:hypothetical protein Q31a_51950 [Aureliella helgolandensis]|uniref:Glycosyltransferase subfamily 4-like N-terminal domain-containing protein n=2 Tax=Aureliella helgolandensis TaxID=2527968 RepID=A0A518GDZ0_9BACT|nr:hypothetical protein Q31a_51950 [Aureliella helgolandensis]